MKRRKFIQYTSLAAGSFLLPPVIANAAKRKPIGIQLYTLKDVIFNDLQGTLKKVAAIGYKEVETFSYGDGKIFGVPFADFVKMSSDLGLKILSGHYSTGFNATTKGNLRNEWERAVADAKSAGQQYMLIAYLDAAERPDLDAYKKVCELINKSAEICKKYGVRLGYHNHDFEFDKFDGQIAYDVMLTQLDPSIVMELDLYWITRAGYSPVEYFAKYPKRFELWHVKDMHKTDKAKNADLGTGSINFVEIFKQAKKSGMKHFFVEQESFEVSSVQSAENDYRYLTGIL